MGQKHTAFSFGGSDYWGAPYNAHFFPDLIETPLIDWHRLQIVPRGEITVVRR